MTNRSINAAAIALSLCAIAASVHRANASEYNARVDAYIKSLPYEGHGEHNCKPAVCEAIAAKHGLRFDRTTGRLFLRR